MEYTVIDNRDYYQFLDDVRELIDNGWELQGGVAVTALTETDTFGESCQVLMYAQALIKKG